MEIQYTREDHSIGIAINSGDEPSKPCIFKVPDILRGHSPKSFTPNSFSIGPLHYQKEHLKEQEKAEKIKQHYLNNLFTRKPTPQTTLEDFKRSILEVEEKARQCYDVPFVHISKDEFVDMLVLDGCFIIELLRNINIDMKKLLNINNNNNTIDEDDPIINVSWVRRVVSHDLTLLENQIPWFVLVRLFDMTSPTISSSTESLTELALIFFGTILSNRPLPKIEGTHKSNHILDLIRNALVSLFGTRQESTEKSSHKNNHIMDLRSALLTSSRTAKKKKKRAVEEWVRYVQLLPTTRLKESGIRFKKDESINLLDIRFSFKYGVLKIPYFIISGITCVTLRNLISYEQCYPNCKAIITSYATLLNNLITTPKDIEVLHEAGIVDSFLNPSDALEFFKNVSSDTTRKELYYSQIFRQVNEYTDRWWPRFRAAYMRMFRDPIACLSLFAATIALILTLLQTLYTVMQFYKDKDSSPSPSPPPPS